MPSDRTAFLRHNLKKYCGVTWPGWLNILIWTPILIALSVFTVNDLISVIHDFYENNTAVQIDVIKTEIIKRPSDMTVCVPYYSQQLSQITGDVYNNYKVNKSLTCNSTECTAMQNQSWNVWNTSEFQDRINPDEIALDHSLSFQTEIAAAIIKKMLNNKNASRFLDLTESNFNWNQPIVDAMWHFLSCISRADLNFLIFFEIHSDVALGGGCFPFDLNLTQIDWTTNPMIDHIYSKALDALNLYFEPRITDTKERTTLTLWNDRFCFRLREDSNQKYFRYRRFQSDKYLPPWKRQSVTYFQVAEDATSLFISLISLDDEDHLYSTAAADLDRDHEDVTLTYNVESRVVDRREKRKCSDTVTPAACVADGQLDVAIKHCKCLPFALRYLRPNLTDLNLPYCDNSAYVSCKEIVDEKKDSLWKKCRNKCEDTIYKWKQESVNVRKNGGQNMLNFQLGLRAKQNLFVEFSYIDKNSFQQFLSQIGGLAGLYLGLSGLTLCTILLFCIDFAKRCYGSKRKSAVQEQTSSPSRNLFRMKTFASMLQSRASEPNANGNEIDRIRAEMQTAKEALSVEVQNMKDTLATEVRKINETLTTELQTMKQILAQTGN